MRPLREFKERNKGTVIEEIKVINTSSSFSVTSSSKSMFSSLCVTFADGRDLILTLENALLVASFSFRAASGKSLMIKGS